MRGLQTNGISWQGTASQPDLSEGLCASGQYDPELWWPHENYSRDQTRAEEDAAQVCLRCPVQPRCLRYVASRYEESGVWGGSTPKDRVGARREARRAHLEGQAFTDRVWLILEEKVRMRA